MGRFTEHCKSEHKIFNEKQLNLKFYDQPTVSDDPEIRYLSADCGIQPRKSNNYGIPTDIIDVFKASSEEGDNSLNDFLANRLSNVRIHRLFIRAHKDVFELTSTSPLGLSNTTFFGVN